MKTIKINGKEYKFEFSIEASLYNDCTTSVTNLMTSAELAREEGNIKDMLSTISDIPKVAISMFYAGLMEHHGKEIASIDDAKALVKLYLSENKDNEDGNFYSVMQQMMECMADDGFFKLIGLETMMKQTEKAPKVPQDHKKKQSKVTGK